MGEVIRSSFFWLALYESSPCVSRKKSIRHVVAFLFIAGTAPLWARSPAATCVSQARKNWDFDTQGCKTGEMKTYLSPGSALYFQIRRGMRREIPGLHKTIYGNPFSFRLQIPLFCRKGNLPVATCPSLAYRAFAGF